MRTMGEPWVKESCPEDIQGCSHYVSWYGMPTGTNRDYFQVAEAAEKAIAKRFTDAELAAEYWQAKANTRIRAYKRDESGNIVDVPGFGWEYEHQIWSRFATTPHYNEA